MENKALREAWLERAMEQYEESLLRMCFVYLGDAQLAEDAVQETFLKAYRSLSGFRGEASEKTWLLRIASNTCIDFLRKKKRRNTISMTELDDLDQPIERQIADYSQDPALLAEKAQDHEAVRAAMAALPAHDRLILSMRAIEDMSYQEIGDALELPPGTVKSRISRAREKIRRALGGNLSTFSASDKRKGGRTS